MIVFDLKCGKGHVFEAWFGSSGDYEAQKARGLVTCPTCDDPAVEKAAMAPAVPAKGNQRPASAPPSAPQIEPTGLATLPPEDVARMRAVVEHVAKLQARMLKDSAWVGQAFAEKARAMHYGEEPAAAIHGVTDAKEARALIEEGITVAPLPIPVIPPGEHN